MDSPAKLFAHFSIVGGKKLSSGQMSNGLQTRDDYYEGVHCTFDNRGGVVL